MIGKTVIQLEIEPGQLLHPRVIAFVQSVRKHCGKDACQFRYAAVTFADYSRKGTITLVFNCQICEAREQVTVMPVVQDTGER